MLPENDPESVSISKDHPSMLNVNEDHDDSQEASPKARQETTNAETQPT